MHMHSPVLGMPLQPFATTAHFQSLPVKGPPASLMRMRVFRHCVFRHFVYCTGTVSLWAAVEERGQELSGALRVWAGVAMLSALSFVASDQAELALKADKKERKKEKKRQRKDRRRQSKLSTAQQDGDAHAHAAGSATRKCSAPRCHSLLACKDYESV